MDSHGQTFGYQVTRAEQRGARRVDEVLGRNTLPSGEYERSPVVAGGALALAGDAVTLARAAAIGVQIKEHGQQIVDGTNAALRAAGHAVGHTFDEARKRLLAAHTRLSLRGRRRRRSTE